MRHLDLFSGIGGFSLAAQWTWGKEHDIVAFCEIDLYCQKVLKKHWPDVPIHNDIRNLHSQEYLNNNVRTFYIPKGNKYNKKELEMAGKLKKLTKDQAENCVKMYESGMSLQPIAEYYGVSRQAMWDMLRRRITLRPQKKYGKANHFSRNGEIADDNAQNIVEYAVRSGVIEKKTHCEICNDTGTFKDGRTKIQAHHSDYNKPLEVEWLCQKCHHEWHKNNTPKRKEVNEGIPGKIDLLTGGFP